MRLIGKIESEDLARKVSFFLKKKGIDTTVDKERDLETKKLTCFIWVHDEDKISDATKYFEEFNENPHDPKYDIPIETRRQKRVIEEVPLVPKRRKQGSIFLTFFFIGICTFIYFLNLTQEAAISKKDGRQFAFIITPIQLLLFYDVPDSVLKLAEVLKLYPLETFTEENQLPQPLKGAIDDINIGIYNWLLAKIKKEDVPSTGPMFVKIRQGEIWRLFSPCILHTSFLHLLFNMLWVWVLGRQIEDKVKLWKILLMFLLIGIISNTFQYLVSGPLFLGFSGIVVGMAGFIWARQKIAPWEGYALHKSTFLFLTIFVFGMLGLQIVLFVVQAAGYEINLQIANTAHIVGGVVGYVLGRSSYFASEAK